MSRFEKIPLYMQWTGDIYSKEHINIFNNRFSQLVFKAVIDSPWVPGVERFLRFNMFNQIFILVSATPQHELEKILRELNLTGCFKKIYGAPTTKKIAIGNTLATFLIEPEKCLMIGDMNLDYIAAKFNRVPFLLRRHGFNSNSFTRYTGPSVRDFLTL